MLTPQFETTIAQAWNGDPVDVMLALHARRSADSVAACKKGWATLTALLTREQGTGAVLPSDGAAPVLAALIGALAPVVMTCASTDGTK